MRSGASQALGARLGTLGLGAVDLALISIYFTPVWGRDAVRALISPYHGLEQRAHATAALYVRDLFDLGWPGLITASHMLAGIKLVIAAAFLAYAIEFARAWATCRPVDRQTTDVVLILAAIGAVIALLPALTLGEPATLRLAATQMLLISGATLVIAVERQVAARATDAAGTAGAPALPAPAAPLAASQPLAQ